MTGVELIVWELLRARKVAGLKFRRQHPVGLYVADFACLSARLIGEVDGPHHDFRTDADMRRDEWFEALGYRILRFSVDEVLRDSETVVLTIQAEVGES